MKETKHSLEYMSAALSREKKALERLLSEYAQKQLPSRELARRLHTVEKNLKRLRISSPT